MEQTTEGSADLTSTPLGKEILVHCYEERRVVLPRVTAYQHAIDAARLHFNISEAINFETTLAENEERYEIAPAAWETMVHKLEVVWVKAIHDNARGSVPQRPIGATYPPHSNDIQVVPQSLQATETIKIMVKPLAGSTQSYNIHGSDSIAKVFEEISNTTGIPVCQIRLIYSGRDISATDLTVAELGITDGSLLHMALKLRKPVIYLYPTAHMDICVELSLSSAWVFSAVYPPVTTQRRKLADGHVGEYIRWEVHADPSGLLKDKSSGKDIAYLFWEAETSLMSLEHLKTPPTSRATSPTPGRPVALPIFEPGTAEVLPPESILLPAQKITSYLDDALTALGLHTEARTSFITYWLPFIMEHSHIALRFVPQTSFDTAAPMVVTPKPDVVTRIFMVARGLNNEEAQHEVWKDASLRASEPVEFWQAIVGMSLQRTLDPALFRVLEWGGMFIN